LRKGLGIRSDRGKGREEKNKPTATVLRGGRKRQWKGVGRGREKRGKLPSSCRKKVSICPRGEKGGGLVSLPAGRRKKEKRKKAFIARKILFWERKREKKRLPTSERRGGKSKKRRSAAPRATGRTPIFPRKGTGNDGRRKKKKGRVGRSWRRAAS